MTVKVIFFPIGMRLSVVEQQFTSDYKGTQSYHLFVGRKTWGRLAETTVQLRKLSTD